MNKSIIISFLISMASLSLYGAEAKPVLPAEGASQGSTATSGWFPSAAAISDKIPNIPLPDFAKITERFSGVLKQAKPYLPNFDYSALGERLKNATPQEQGVLLGTLAVAALYGGYKYNQYRTSSTAQSIDNSLEFITKIMKNPQFLREAWDDTKSETNPTTIVFQKQAGIVNALGLSLSTLKNKSYNQNPKKDIYIAIDDLSTDIIYINGVYKFIKNNAAKAEEAKNEKAVAIEKNSIFLYLKLLQTRNDYKPETLPFILNKINLSDYLAKEEKFKPLTPIKNVYFIVQSYVQKPEDNLNIKTLKNTVMQILFGGAFYQALRMPAKYKTEIPEFEKLFKLISSKEDKNDIIRQAKRCRSIIANRDDFPEADKWLMVQDYLEQFKKPFTLQEEPRGKMVSSTQTQTEKPAVLEFSHGLSVISRTPIDTSPATSREITSATTETRETQPASTTPELPLFDNPWEENSELTKSMKNQTYALSQPERAGVIKKLKEEEAKKSQQPPKRAAEAPKSSAPKKERSSSYWNPLNWFTI